MDLGFFCVFCVPFAPSAFAFRFLPPDDYLRRNCANAANSQLRIASTSV
jgi:hypothetical protein